MTPQKIEQETKMEHLKKTIEKEEKQLQTEMHEEALGLKWFFKSHTLRLLLILLFFAALFFGVYYLAVQEGRIYVENAQILAPVIKLSPQQPGILEKVYVREGDVIPANTIVAQVNGASIKSKIAGIVTAVQNTPGQYVTAQTAIVQMIDPNELRVVGRVQEDKGLNEIKKGQKVVFTADAFDKKEYAGVIDSIAPAARTGDLVFSISDKRQEQEFTIGVRYPVASYPELKQGMSAKLWVYR